MNRSSKQRISKEIQTLNETLDQMDIFNGFRTFHSNAEENTIFSSAHGTFSRIDHILSKFNKFNKIEIIPSLFCEHNAMRLDINYRKKLQKTQTHRH